MKNYDNEIIKQYIEKNKDKIEFVSCGMKEDWSWTADTIFKNGKYEEEFDWDSESISVGGIKGSAWATPVMEIIFNDGRTEIVECWKRDGMEKDSSEIERMKAFARATGGMDCI